MTFGVAVDNALNDIQHKGKSFPVTDHLTDTHYSDAKAGIVMARSINILTTILYEVIQDYLPDALKGSRYVFFKQKKWRISCG